jgi:parallel beta-helix repeat protein
MQPRSPAPARPRPGALLAAGLAAVVAAAAASLLPGPAGGQAGPAAQPRTLHVSRAARPAGDGSAASPFARIADAVAVAGPGDTVLVGAGTYAELLTTVRPGRPAAPIRIVGTPGARLVGPKGIDTGRLLQVLHDYITVESLELSDANILIRVEGASGVRIVGNRLHDAGGECVRLKSYAQRNELANNTISGCGRVRFDLARDKKNGEGIYIGTAPEQSDGWPDRSDGNWVHHNRILPAAECVDVKERARHNLVERNRCSGSDDPDGAGFSSRGDHTTFRGNRSTHHAGAGIRLGGDTATQGLHNNVLGNTLADNAGYGLKVMRTPQGRIAANTIVRNRRGRTNRAS